MFRYKFPEADLKSAVKYLKTKKGRLQQKPWVLKYESDLKVKDGKIRYKDKEIIASENIDDYLRRRVCSKAADINTSRDSAFYQLSKEVVGVSRRAIMEFFRKQKQLGENREATRAPKVKKGIKLSKHVFETDLCFIMRNDLIDQNERFDNDGPEYQYAVVTVEKASGLVRVDYSAKKDAKIVTPIVAQQIKDMCKQLGLDPKKCECWSDKGGEFSPTEIEKTVGTHRFVKLTSSCENKNKIMQRSFYRILKLRQAVTVKTALKKAQNQMNKAWGSIHKMSADEVAEKQKQKEVDTLKTYNKTRKQHVSNTKQKELNVGDYVRILIKPKKQSIDFKSYKNQTWSEEVYQIAKKTKTNKYKLKGKKRYFTLDYLLKSAPRDEKTNELVKKRDIVQKAMDEEQDKRERAQMEKNIKENRERLMKLKEKADEMGIIVPDVNRGIKNLNKIRKLRNKDAKIKGYLDQLQSEYEKEKEKEGIKLKPKKHIKVVGWKPKDDDYDPLSDLEQEIEDQKEDKPARRVTRSQTVKKKLIREYKAQANKVLKMQKKMDKAKDETLNRLLRDMELEIQRGKEMAKEIKKKRYKNHGLNLNFFFQQ